MEKQIHSLKFKITMLIMGIIAGMVLAIVMINSLFITKFFMNEKCDDIVSAYHTIEDIISQADEGEVDRETMSRDIRRAIAPLGVAAYVMDSAWNTVFSSRNEQEEDQDIVMKNILNPQRDKVQVIEQNERYTLQLAYDANMGDNYLEIWGMYADGNIAMLRMPVKSINASVGISNKFVAYVGLVVLMVGLLIVYYLSSAVTKPVKELSEIAERMSELDFTAKYTGNDKSEIGDLGSSINRMSMKLEKNISQLKAANLALTKDIENKIKLEEERNEFISNVSHELKTPIALIQGYAEGIKEGIIDDTESREYYCDVIIDEAKKMNQLVKSLLTLNQMESGEPVEMERFDITELVKSILDANQIRFTQNDIKLIFDSTRPYYVWADEYKIEQVITNYLSNAINHCGNEKVIKVTMQEQNNLVRISVFNTGSNIPKEDIDKIWDKFYKVDKARTREYGGNGIGLSIVKAIMNSYNMGYGVVNHSNGVEFWFELDSRMDSGK